MGNPVKVISASLERFFSSKHCLLFLSAFLNLFLLKILKSWMNVSMLTNCELIALSDAFVVQDLVESGERKSATLVSLVPRDQYLQELQSNKKLAWYDSLLRSCYEDAQKSKIQFEHDKYDGYELVNRKKHHSQKVKSCMNVEDIWSGYHLVKSFQSTLYLSSMKQNTAKPKEYWLVQSALLITLVFLMFSFWQRNTMVGNVSN